MVNFPTRVQVQRKRGFNSHIASNYLRYVSGPNCSLIMFLSSLAAITECCVISGWMLFVNGSESKRSKSFSRHMTQLGKKGERADPVCQSGCHSWLLNRPQHLHEYGFGLTRTDVFLRRITERYCANSSSCSLTVHSTPLTQQKQSYSLS